MLKKPNPNQTVKYWRLLLVFNIQNNALFSCTLVQVTGAFFLLAVKMIQERLRIMTALIFMDSPVSPYLLSSSLFAGSLREGALLTVFSYFLCDNEGRKVKCLQSHPVYTQIPTKNGKSINTLYHFYSVPICLDRITSHFTVLAEKRRIHHCLLQ